MPEPTTILAGFQDEPRAPKCDRVARTPNHTGEPAASRQEPFTRLWDSPVERRGDEETAVDFREEVLIEIELEVQRILKGAT